MPLPQTATARRQDRPDPRAGGDLVSDRFRVTRIDLDEQENVQSVTVTAQPDTASMIRGMLGGDMTVTSSGNAAVTIELPADDAMRLYRECGQMPGTDPRSADTGVIPGEPEPGLRRADRRVIRLGTRRGHGRAPPAPCE
jgi:hypothetical protein